MSTNFDFRLTARAASVLTAMLEHAPAARPSFAALLRSKLNHSSICFASDIPSGVVTLNSHVLYTVDGQNAGPHLIVPTEGDDFPDYALSIHELRGLALLGLTEGQSITIEEENGKKTTLTVVRVGYRPDSIAWAGDPPPALVQPQVVQFRPRPSQAPSFEPDDPGPRAA